MTERLILELKIKYKNDLKTEEEKIKSKFLINNNGINNLIDDLQLTLQSLNYTKKEISSIMPIIIKESDKLIKNEKNISFENLLKLAMNFLDHDRSNIVR